MAEEKLTFNDLDKGELFYKEIKELGQQVSRFSETLKRKKKFGGRRNQQYYLNLYREYQNGNFGLPQKELFQLSGGNRLKWSEFRDQGSKTIEIEEAKVFKKFGHEGEEREGKLHFFR